MNYYKCDNLSQLNETKINELFNKSLELNLNTQNILSMNKNINFGTEIEFLTPYKSEDKIHDYLEKNFKDYKIEVENACYEGEYGYAPLEISTPKLRNSKSNLKELNHIFNYIFDNNAMINLSCGNHIHYDINILKNKYIYYERFLKFFSVYEPIIYMFSCGEINFLRNTIGRHAKDIGKDYYITLKDDNKKNIKYLKRKYIEKEFAIRFTAFNTIEIRTPMGTLNPAINQNNILFFYKIFEYVTSKNYDNELINKKFNNDIENRKSALLECGKININNKNIIGDVLELSDLLYDNNLDKMYFLKQCLKIYNKTDFKYTNINNILKK